jgi:membrane associated rhomboid family serine protease
LKRFRVAVSMLTTVWLVCWSPAHSMNFLHLAANMFLLDQFGRDVARILTPERFVALYLAGGLAAVLTSLASRRVLRNNVLSLGASGSVMAVLFMFANLFPNRSVHFFGIYELPAKDAVILWALIDAAGMLGSFGKIDFAAHLGGGAFSFGYYNMIREALSREHYERMRHKGAWFERKPPIEEDPQPSQLRRSINRLREER